MLTLPEKLIIDILKKENVKAFSVLPKLEDWKNIGNFVLVDRVSASVNNHSFDRGIKTKSYTLNLNCFCKGVENSGKSEKYLAYEYSAFIENITEQIFFDNNVLKFDVLSITDLPDKDGFAGVTLGVFLEVRN